MSDNTIYSKFFKPFTMNEIIKNNPLKGEIKDDDYILIHHKDENDGIYKPAYITLEELRNFMKM